MDSLPADVIRQIPATYRCWLVLRMVCRSTCGALVGDYHHTRGYEFTSGPDRKISYAEYARAMRHRLCAGYRNDCTLKGVPTWFIYPEDDPDYIAYESHECNFWVYENMDQCMEICDHDKQYILYTRHLYHADDVRLLAELLYYEFPSFRWKIVRVSSSCEFIRQT